MPAWLANLQLYELLATWANRALTAHVYVAVVDTGPDRSIAPLEVLFAR